MAKPLLLGVTSHSCWGWVALPLVLGVPGGGRDFGSAEMSEVGVGGKPLLLGVTSHSCWGWEAENECLALWRGRR